MEDTHTHVAPEYVPIGEAARKLGVSIETVRRWAKAGHIAETRTVGGQRRFSTDEIERVLSEQVKS